jgi:hypothetical protein
MNLPGSELNQEQTMTDFTKNTIADMAAERPDINMGTTGSMHEINWENEDVHWRENHARQPYAVADRPYDFYRQAYKYGYEASFVYGRRPWDNEVESDLARGWPQARAESTAEWEQVRGAVREAYSRAGR